MKKKLVVFLVAFFAIFAMPHNARAAMAMLDLNQEFELTSAHRTQPLNRYKCYLAPQSETRAYTIEISGATEGKIEDLRYARMGDGREVVLDIKWKNGKAYGTTPSLEGGKNIYMFYIQDDTDETLKVKITRGTEDEEEVPEFSGSVSGRIETGSTKNVWYKTKIEKAGEYILEQNPSLSYNVALCDKYKANVRSEWTVFDQRKGTRRVGYNLEPGDYYVQVSGVANDNVPRDINYTISLTPRNSYITGLSNVELKSIDTIQLGTGRDIFFTTTPADSNDGVIFESSDPTIAKIISGTEVYFLKEGQVQLTAKNGKGDVLGTWVLTISKNSATFKEGKLTPSSNNNTNNTTKPGVVKVTKIKINGQSNTIANGKSIQLSAQITPSNATNKKVTWTSSNKKYATVSANGKVTTKKAGKGKTVTITAKANDGSNVKATYKIKIAKGVVKKVKISGKKTVKAGKTLKLKAKVTASKGAYKKVVWTTSNKKYATVSASGKVKALKAGKKKTVTITAKAIDGSGKKATIKIKIK